MSNELSETDAQKLFAQISAADNDPLKLDELMKTPDEGGNPDPNLTTDPAKPDVTDPPEGGDGANGDPAEGKVEGNEGNPPAGDGQPEVPADNNGDNPNEPDELAKLREQLDKLGKENHALKSQAGRVPHVQRRLKELEERLEALNKPSPANHPSATIQPKVLEQLKGIREADPELADAVAKAIEEATSGFAAETVARQRELLELQRNQELASYQSEQVGLLLEMIPNAKEVVASPQWSEWKNAQSADIVRLAESDDAQSVALAMRLYGDAMRVKYPQLASPIQKTDSNKPSDEDAAKAAKIEQERIARQAAASKVNASNVTPQGGLPDDPEALFNKYYADIRGGTQ